MKTEELKDILLAIECCIILNEGMGTVSLKQLYNRLSDAITELEQQSQEEAKERYDRAVKFISSETYMNGFSKHGTDMALQIASGYKPLKEE